MSLATRCTSCGTIFRVVQDQLKVSEGWVRCGQCDEVFNALRGVFDLEHESPPEWERAPRTASESSTVDASHGSDDLRDLSNPRSTHPPATDNHTATATATDTSDIRTASHAEPARPPVDFSSGRERGGDTAPSVEISADVFHDIAEQESRRPAASANPLDTPQSSAAALPLPDFVQQARQQARWQSRRFIATMWVAALILVILLAAQVLHHFRDLAVSRWPNLKPELTSLCAAMDCVIAAPRRIDSVAVENSALTRGVAPDSIRLALTLRNRGTYPVAMPSVDLSLTNLAGQLIARRALSPREFGVISRQLEPGSELPLQALLSTGNSLVAGYTVEVFYP